MATFEIKGGCRLKGDLHPQGAKNEALQVLCCVLLTPEKVIIDNIPRIRDVLFLIDLLDQLGVSIEQLEDNKYSFEAAEIDFEYIKSDQFKEHGGRFRGSIMIVGPMLARFGKGFIPAPGGDKIGRRRLDTHFTGFQNLGATFTYDQKENFYKVEADRLQGTSMLLDEASVTGTANILMAAVLAKGKTSIYLSLIHI